MANDKNAELKFNEAEETKVSYTENTSQTPRSGERDRDIDSITSAAKKVSETKGLKPLEAGSAIATFSVLPIRNLTRRISLKPLEAGSAIATR